MKTPKQFHRPLITLLLVLWLSIAANAHGQNAYSHDPEAKTSNPDWMAKIKDETRISRLSIPGTHETMALYWGDAVACQSMSLWD